MRSIDIVDDGDLNLEVTEYNGTTQETSHDKDSIEDQVQFLVSIQVLETNSIEFAKLLRKLAPKGNSTMKFKSHVKPLEICLRILHTNPLDEAFYAISVEEMWYVLGAIKRYRLDVKLFRDWFIVWCVQKQSFDCQMIMYPAWEFDIPELFAKTTKIACYGVVGHITEKNPTPLHDLHLPPRIIQQLNAAKGRLRTMLFRGLLGSNERLLKAGCLCRKETLYDYEEHLSSTGVWPLEQIGLKASISTILERLESFSFEPEDNTDCDTCCHPIIKITPRESEYVTSYTSYIQGVINHVGNYFDGLCLDCLDRSKPKFGDANSDHWMHANLGEEDTREGCRIEHCQPTWYFSYMGRIDLRDRLLKGK